MPPAIDCGLPLRLAIQNALRRRLWTTEFPEVVYATESGAFAAASIKDKRVKPASVEVQEIRSEFDDSPGARGGRDPWIFELRLGFDCEVSLEEWEDEFRATPMRVCSEGRRCRRVLLTDADYQHPPRQNSSGGTHVTYTLRARLG